MRTRFSFRKRMPILRLMRRRALAAEPAWQLAQTASAMLFTSAKVTHLNSLPQGQPQRDQRTLSMVATMRNEVFGSCTNHGECEAVCPKQIPIEFIGKLNRDLIRGLWHRHREPLTIPSVVQLPCVEDAHEHFHDDIRPSQEVARRQLREEVTAHLPVESPEHAERYGNRRRSNEEPR